MMWSVRSSDDTGRVIVPQIEDETGQIITKVPGAHSEAMEAAIQLAYAHNKGQ